MENDNQNQKNYSYGKRPLWQWILIYIVIAGIVYGLIYYFFFMKNGGYTYNSSQDQNIVNSNNNSAISSDKVLNLSNQGLTKIPDNVFNQTNLEELNVSHNSLTGAIQSQIGQLKILKVLNASYNKMTGVPAEVGQLSNLQVLD